jgi:hypothetical protein
VSTREWIPSDSTAELPVIVPATNLVMAITRLPGTAAQITASDPDAMLEAYRSHALESDLVLAAWNQSGTAGLAAPKPVLPGP